jgi:hypothetical protein
MYTETEFEKLIKSVETEFSAHLLELQNSNTVESLAKAEDGGKPPEKKESKEKPKATEGEPPSEEGAEEAPPAEGEEAPEGEMPEGEMPVEGEAPMAPGAPEAGMGHDYDEEDLAHMEQMYMSMSPAELKAHHDAIMRIVQSQGAGPEAAPAGPPMEGAPVQKSELNAHGESENPPQPKVKGDNLDSDPANGGIEGQEPNNSPGAKSPASKAKGVQMGKSEHARRNGGKIEGQAPSGSPGAKAPATKDQGNLTNMEKSENTELELAKAEANEAKTKAETLQKSLDLATQFLSKLLEKRGAPQGKAITELEVIAKGETATEEKTLTKSEVDGILNRKSQDPKLEKSDRELINNFYLSGGSLNSIRHLLK